MDRADAMAALASSSSEAHFGYGKCRLAPNRNWGLSTRFGNPCRLRASKQTCKRLGAGCRAIAKPCPALDSNLQVGRGDFTMRLSRFRNWYHTGTSGSENQLTWAWDPVQLWFA
ncbi:hypothetical protein PoMZ_10775 [Pyricularia oryzae]|uniref:Uncharacterized protein n=1 Tax=Pyricularia oryzae TaxID=318829 RepID=A0A4P7MYI2_PYROR|nr:hypothetical protein PoMZ_10775 [Pyricularia oryzae]